jgi:hypothetical protein
MRIHKSATYIPLPTGWKSRLKGFKDEKLLWERNLIEE